MFPRLDTIFGCRCGPLLSHILVTGQTATVIVMESAQNRVCRQKRFPCMISLYRRGIPVGCVLQVGGHDVCEQSLNDYRYAAINGVHTPEEARHW